MRVTKRSEDTKMTDMSVDIETLASHTEMSAVPEIAAILFNPQVPGEYEILEYEVNVKALINEYKMKYSEDTVSWWTGTDEDKLRRMLSDDYGDHPTKVIEEFTRDLFDVFGKRKDMACVKRVWARSPSFDCVKLGGMWQAVLGQAYPWGWWCERCTRTLEDLVGVSTKRLNNQIKFGEVDMFSILVDILKERDVKAHDAVYDAAREADLVVYAVQNGMLKI